VVTCAIQDGGDTAGPEVPGCITVDLSCSYMAGASPLPGLILASSSKNPFPSFSRVAVDWILDWSSSDESARGPFDRTERVRLRTVDCGRSTVLDLRDSILKVETRMLPFW
jgi:hypothetical protein